jgi:hypothetical protein
MNCKFVGPKLPPTGTQENGSTELSDERIHRNTVYSLASDGTTLSSAANNGGEKPGFSPPPE